MGEPVIESFVTAEELSALLKIKTKTLLNWAGQGRMPSYKINGVRRFRVSEVKAWLDAERLSEQSRSKRADAVISELRFLKTGNNRLIGNQRGTKGTH